MKPVTATNPITPDRIGTASLRDQVRQFERSVIDAALRDCGGDRRRAAHRLGIGLSSLYRKLGETGH